MEGGVGEALKRGPRRSEVESGGGTEAEGGRSEGGRGMETEGGGRGEEEGR